MNLPQGHNPLLRVHKCDNFHQMQEIDGNHNCKLYPIKFFQRSSDNIGYKLKLKTAKAYSGKNNTRMYNLYKEYNTYLDKDSTNTGFDVVWCSFIWSFLINEDINKQYGDHIWIWSAG